METKGPHPRMQHVTQILVYQLIENLKKRRKRSRKRRPVPQRSALRQKLSSLQDLQIRLTKAPVLSLQQQTVQIQIKKSISVCCIKVKILNSNSQQISQNQMSLCWVSSVFVLTAEGNLLSKQTHLFDKFLSGTSLEIFFVLLDSDIHDRGFVIQRSQIHLP